MKKGHLVIFVKAPRLGAVKTRLGAEIGHINAWRFYKSMLARLWRHFGKERCWHTSLAISPDRGAARWPRALQRRGQGQGGLGRRMARAMAGSDGPVVLVGGDIPDLRSGHIRQAFRALRRADTVFGPAEDGGYWLVGLRRGRWADRLFRNVRWSSAHALADTIANLPVTARYVKLETLRDVDTAADFAAYSRCSRNRGISSAKLQGRKRISS